MRRLRLHSSALRPSRLAFVLSVLAVACLEPKIDDLPVAENPRDPLPDNSGGLPPGSAGGTGNGQTGGGAGAGGSGGAADPDDVEGGGGDFAGDAGVPNDAGFVQQSLPSDGGDGGDAGVD